jgi:hypothetical protein
MDKPVNEEEYEKESLHRSILWVYNEIQVGRAEAPPAAACAGCMNDVCIRS